MPDPWFKFYPTDWRSDPALRTCSLAARGLWIEVIGLMHEATPYGHLLVSGRSPTDAQLAVLAGTTPDQIPELLGELDAAGVFSRTKEGVIYSRKMTRAAKKSAIARKNGKSGGNPSLCNNSKNPPLDNHRLKGDVKPQKPEARSQKEKRDTDVSQKPPDGFDEFWASVPKKVAPDKARSAYAKALRKTDAATILNSMRAYAESRQGEDPQFTAHPATWLNGGRWNDEITKPGGNHGKPNRLDAMLRGAASSPLDRGPDRHPSQPLLAAGRSAGNP